MLFSVEAVLAGLFLDIKWILINWLIEQQMTKDRIDSPLLNVFSSSLWISSKIRATARMAECEETFAIRAKKYYYEGPDQPCGLVTINGWSEFIKDNKAMIISVLDDDSKLAWTFMVNSSLKKRRKSKKLKIKIPGSKSSILQNLICVTAKLVVDVSDAQRSPLKHFRVVSPSDQNATLDDGNDPLLLKFRDLDISQCTSSFFLLCLIL